MWDDPDGYVDHARALVQHGSWRWTFAAVEYDINGRRHALPPLYTVFLSAFALFPHFPLTARIAQACLALVSIGLVFDLGRTLHSTRAGLIAAAGYALWIPQILNVWSTSQETVYLPLMLFALTRLARAVTADAAPARFVVIGVFLGIAALTRSMPMLFVVPAALLHVALGRLQRRALTQAAALVIGFGVITVPYSLALSRHFGQWTFIDSHGSIHVAATGDAATGRAPGIEETAAALAREIAADPAKFAAETADRARTLFYVNGGRLLQIYVVAGSRAAAIAWKIVMHLGSDVLLIASLALAGLGAAVIRERRAAALVLLWMAVNVGVASVGGFGGARLRAPVEPMLLVFAAAFAAGAWTTTRWRLAAGACASVALIATIVVPQLGRTIRAWPDYGVAWPSVLMRKTGEMTGAAGVNVLIVNNAAELSVTPRGASGSGWVRLRVSLDGVVVQTIAMARGEPRTIRCWSPAAGGLAYLELEAVDAASSAPAQLAITHPR